MSFVSTAPFFPLFKWNLSWLLGTRKIRSFLQDTQKREGQYIVITERNEHLVLELLANENGLRFLLYWNLMHKSFPCFYHWASKCTHILFHPSYLLHFLTILEGKSRQGSWSLVCLGVLKHDRCCVPPGRLPFVYPSAFWKYPLKCLVFPSENFHLFSLTFSACQPYPSHDHLAEQHIVWLLAFGGLLGSRAVPLPGRETSKVSLAWYRRPAAALNRTGCWEMMSKGGLTRSQHS